MTHKTPGIRLATTAIAVVLALSSAQLLAQAAPTATPPVAVAPSTAVPDSAPAVTIPSEPLTSSVSDPIAPEPTITTPKSSKSTPTHRAASVARPAKVAAPAARAPVAAPVAAPVPTPAAPVEAALGPVAAPPPPAQVVAPVVATRPAQDGSIMSADMLPIAGAVGIGLLGLIGLGLAMRRRRRRTEDELAAAEQYEPAIDEAPAVPDPLFAEPAFAAAASPAAASASAEFLPEGAEGAPAGTPTDCVDAARGSHVEAACEGPSADNPSLSIKKRLKRAHFFDEREQLVAAGLAVPVEP
ncbi:MAG TPA: hypothetical protein VKC17_06585, partial [Sphingomicrobium sp.]|nr:hypothetical protein [Sphingomicrobium sp.]